MDSRETRTYLTATVLVIGSLFVCGTAFDSVFLRHRSGLLALSNLIAGLALVGLVASVVAGKLRCTAGSMCACLIAGAAWIPCWPLSWQHHLGFGIAVLSLYALGIPALADWLDKRGADHAPAHALPPQQIQAPPPKALGGTPAAAAQQHDSRQGGDPLSDDVYPEPKAAAVRVVAPVMVADTVPNRMAAVAVLPKRMRTVVDRAVAETAAQKLLQEMTAWRVNCGGQMFVADIAPLSVRFRYAFGTGTEGRFPDGPAVAERQAAIASRADELAGALGFNSGALTVERPLSERRYVDLVVALEQKPMAFREAVTRKAFTMARREGDFVAVLGEERATGELVTLDFGNCPHIIVCGETNAGKGRATHSILMSLLLAYGDTEVTIIDPKSGLDFQHYARFLGVPQVVQSDDIHQATAALAAVVDLMRKREDFLRGKATSVAEFNRSQSLVARYGRIPRHVVVIDEYAQLVEAEALLGRRKQDEPPRMTDHVATLTARARTAGAHIVLVTQRPDSDVVSGQIRGNVSGRVVLKCAEIGSSRVAFGHAPDAPDATTLNGFGDAWVRFKSGRSVVYRRVQFPLFEADHVQALCRELARLHASGSVAA